MQRLQTQVNENCSIFEGAYICAGLACNRLPPRHVNERNLISAAFSEIGCMTFFESPVVAKPLGSALLHVIISMKKPGLQWRGMIA